MYLIFRAFWASFRGRAIRRRRTPLIRFGQVWTAASDPGRSIPRAFTKVAAWNPQTFWAALMKAQRAVINGAPIGPSLSKTSYRQRRASDVISHALSSESWGLRRASG